MILVTLGTHPVPMDRLLRRMDDLVASGEIADEVVVQTPALNYVPSHLTVHEIVPFERLRALVRDARVVISHAGPGSLALIRSEGRMPVVVPRSAAFREHVDDHQQRYARRIRELPGYLVVEDLDGLAAAIAEASETRPVKVVQPSVDGAVALLRGIIGCS